MTTRLHAAGAATGRVSPETDGFPPHRRRRRRTPGHPDARLAARTAPDRQHDPSDGGDPGPDGRLLSVSEIQQALRELRARRPDPVPDRPTPPPRHRPGDVAGSAGAPMPTHPRCAEEDTGGAAAGAQADRSREWPAGLGAGVQRGRGRAAGTSPACGQDEPDSGLPAGWVAVAAAHAGAGASTVALALGDAAASADRRVHLVETAVPARSGLVAAACAELGADATGRWRRGSRCGVVIDRRAEVVCGGWPTPPVGEGPAVTVVDLGLPAAAELGRLSAAGVRTVIVCRATVPGVRLTEQVLGQVLGQVTGAPIVVAAVGPRRWPGEITASLGPRLRELRSGGRVVPVPTDRRLEITGPDASPLPKPVRAAGRALWQLLDAAGPGVAADPASCVSPRPGSAR